MGPAVNTSTIPSACADMSDDSPPSGYALKWEIQVRAYQTGAAGHIHVIRCTKGYVDPTPPADPDEVKAWDMGVW